MRKAACTVLFARMQGDRYSRRFSPLLLCLVLRVRSVDALSLSGIGKLDGMVDDTRMF